MQKTGEYNSNNAFIYNGNTGNVNNNNKYNTNAVRPVSEFQGNVDPFASFYKSMRAAYRLCLKNKVHTANAIRFWLDEESELVALAREVFNCEYVPRQSIAFIVTKPCLREVVAADFRDRITTATVVKHFRQREICKYNVRKQRRRDLFTLKNLLNDGNTAAN